MIRVTTFHGPEGAITETRHRLPRHIRQLQAALLAADRARLAALPPGVGGFDRAPVPGETWPAPLPEGTTTVRVMSVPVGGAPYRVRAFYDATGGRLTA